MSDFDGFLSGEVRRAQMQALLQRSSMAMMTAIDENGDLFTMYFGANRLELLGLRDKCSDHVDEFEKQASDMEILDDEDDPD